LEYTFETRRALVAPFLERGEREPALVWARTPVATRTLGESRVLVLEAADELMELGLDPGTLVGLVMPSAASAVEALAAAWLADLVPVLIDPGLPSGAEVALARKLGAAFAWRPPEVWERSLDVDALVPTSPSPRLLSAAAAVKLTSGSTGEPQGVAVSAAALHADTDTLVRAFELTREDRGLVAVPLSHSYGFSVLTLPALTHGLGLAFPARAEAWSAARELAATFLPSVPAWYRSVLRLEERCAPSLHLFVSAGAPLSPEVAREFRARFGRAIHVLYGASECGSMTFDREGTAAERGTVGRPLPGVTLELEGAEGDAPGLVTVRSPACGLGYVPERPSARLTSGRYQTEDLARWRDGELELRGRTSDWINVKGRKVDPRAVEAAIAAHPAVREVVVLGKPLVGSTEESVRAVIVLHGELDFLALTEWCRARLAAYQLPRSVVFVDELPRSERGKLDRQRLLDL
jgi:acyl-CoA synthetase (AMP-forming)/AMP-acid ligase II